MSPARRIWATERERSDRERADALPCSALSLCLGRVSPAPGALTLGVAQCNCCHQARVVGEIGAAALVVALIAAGALALLRFGERGGDRHDDALVSVSVVWLGQADGPVPHACIDVVNRGMHAVIASASAQRGRLPDLVVSGAPTRGTSLRQRRTLGGDALLGAVDAQESARWFLPLETAGGRMTVSVRLSQDAMRTRIHRAPLHVDANALAHIVPVSDGV